MKRKRNFTEDEIVENRLRLFVNKYYRIKVFQGLIITISVALIVFICLITFGNAVDAGKVLKSFSTIAGISVLAAVLSYFILKPLAQRFGFVKGLNFKEASGIIQQKHKSVEDRIINIIELTRERYGQNNKLYDYAIAQKTANIQDIKFEDAISLKKLGVFIIRLLLLSSICIGVVLMWPDFVKKGIGAMLSGSEQIAAENRIEFAILNDLMEVESGRDFLMRFQVSSALPVDNVSVKLGSSDEKADPVTGGYEYMFNAVNSDVSFRLAANGIVSGEYVLKVLKRPEIANVQLKIAPPAYTGLGTVVVEGDGNAEIPGGSRVSWSIKTVNTDELVIIDENDTAPMNGRGNLWIYEKNITKSTEYELLCKNRNGLSVNYFYKISIVKDLYPTVDISESRDSTAYSDIYIEGVIQDDYGFSKLEVVKGSSGSESVKEIEIKKVNIYEKFYYIIVPDSNTAVYYLRIWDNDRISGPKYSESRKISVRMISKLERENINSKLVDSINSSMAKGMSAIEKMEKKISLFKMEQVLGELKPWEVQEKIKELNNLKQEVVDFLNNISKANKEFTENEEILNQDKDFAERAKEIQELMEGLLDDEMKELIKQFEELAKEFSSVKVDELTDKMEMNLEKLKEQMEMSLELLKKYNMEKDLMKQVGKLHQLADSVQNSKEQEGGSENVLKEEFKKWEEGYEKTLQEDQELKKPMGLEKMEKEREEARKAAEELDKKGGGKSSAEKKESTSKSLKKLARRMENMMGMMNGEAQSVDLEDLRQIRNSLNDYSKWQEELNNRVVNLNRVSPAFAAVIKEQKELEDKFLSVRDSLKSMGYRQPVIAKMIGSELFHVETSIKNLFESYAGSRFNVVRIEQNRIMSEINLIAVKLDELISSMREAKGSGSGQPQFTDRKKPKSGEQKGSEKLGESKSTQESLKEQLKSTIQKMKSGANGKKERGELARMLGEREMMRKALEKTLQEGGLGKEGREKANQALEMMKEVEKDIIYNRLGERTLEKDNLIRTKLLEAENAEKERENENRRESKEFKGIFDPNRRELEPGIGQNKALEQMLKYNELKLKRFYQEKYLKYIESTKK